MGRRELGYQGESRRKATTRRESGTVSVARNPSSLIAHPSSTSSSIGRAPAFQAGGCGIVARLVLSRAAEDSLSVQFRYPLRGMVATSIIARTLVKGRRARVIFHRRKPVKYPVIPVTIIALNPAPVSPLATNQKKG